MTASRQPKERGRGMAQVGWQFLAETSTKQGFVPETAIPKRQHNVLQLSVLKAFDTAFYSSKITDCYQIFDSLLSPYLALYGHQLQ